MVCYHPARFELISKAQSGKEIKEECERFRYLNPDQLGVGVNQFPRQG